MATYVILGHWTAEGVENIQDSPKRLDAVKKHFKGKGVQVRDFYLLFGPHDFLLIVDAKDDQKLASALLDVVSAGNVATETYHAFDEDAYRRIIKNVG